MLRCYAVVSLERQAADKCEAKMKCQDVYVSFLDAQRAGQRCINFSTCFFSLFFKCVFLKALKMEVIYNGEWNVPLFRLKHVVDGWAEWRSAYGKSLLHDKHKRIKFIAVHCQGRQQLPRKAVRTHSLRIQQNAKWTLRRVCFITDNEKNFSWKFKRLTFFWGGGGGDKLRKKKVVKL